MTTRTDRLWSSSLTDDERARARQVYEESPSILDAAVYAALGPVDRGDELVDAMLRRVRSCEV